MLMTLTELLLAGTAMFAALAGVLYTIVLWNGAPRYRRVHRSSWGSIGHSSSALHARTPGHHGEGSLPPSHSPRTRVGIVRESVADAVGGPRAGSAEVLYTLQ